MSEEQADRKVAEAVAEAVRLQRAAQHSHSRECSKMQATTGKFVALVAGFCLAFLFWCGVLGRSCGPWSLRWSLFPWEGVEFYMSGDCKSERLNF